MAKSDPPANISDLVDRLDTIREELLRIQNSLEKMEPKKPIEAPDGKP